MSGLVLKLGPHERVLVNGAVIQNGDRRGRLSILTPNAHILRLKDALHPEEAGTPVRRVCYIAQLVLSGDAEPDAARLQLLRGIEQLSQVFTDADSRTQLAAATACVADDKFYPALKALRALIAREDRLFAAAAVRPPGGARIPAPPRSPQARPDRERPHGQSGVEQQRSQAAPGDRGMAARP
jgi:flagellar protein FlbT